MSYEQISFIDSDFKYPHLEVVATEIADFLLKYKSKLDDYSALMRVSAKWTIDNYKSQLQIWSSGYVGNKKKAAPDTIKLAELAEKQFDACNTNKEIWKMRGLVPEKFFERIFDRRHQGKRCKLGYGVKVEVKGDQVIYICHSPYEREGDSDKTRQTVDAGYWDGDDGEFVEVKFSPEAFHTKDINYLKLLTSTLRNHKINYTVLLVCFGHKGLTEKKLQRLELWNNDVKEFLLVGKDEIYSL